MQNLSTTPTNSKSTTKSPQLLVVFTLDGMESHAICSDTEAEQTELERLLQLIQPGLAAVNRVWQQNSAGRTV